jgi:hypothetical protein
VRVDEVEVTLLAPVLIGLLTAAGGLVLLCA